VFANANIRGVFRSWALCSLVECDGLARGMSDSFAKLILLCVALFVVFSLLGCTNLARTAHASYGHWYQLPTSAPAGPYPPSLDYRGAHGQYQDFYEATTGLGKRNKQKEAASALYE